jgi:hypothetical protein
MRRVLTCERKDYLRKWNNRLETPLMRERKNKLLDKATLYKRQQTIDSRANTAGLIPLFECYISYSKERYLLRFNAIPQLYSSKDYYSSSKDFRIISISLNFITNCYKEKIYRSCYLLAFIIIYRIFSLALVRIIYSSLSSFP